MSEISYAGIDEAVLVHGLYEGTCAAGLGIMHSHRDVTVDDVRKILRPDANGRIYIDYLAGRPLKVDINTKTKMVSTHLYDRDSMVSCQEVVNTLRAKGT